MEEADSSYEFEPGLFLSPFADDARRNLINAAREAGNKCSDATLTVLHHAEFAMFKEVPTPRFGDILGAIVYRRLFEFQLERWAHCFLISEKYNHDVYEYCWRPPVIPLCNFAVPGTIGNMDFGNAVALWADWQPNDPTDLLLLEGEIHAQPILDDIAANWPRLRRLCDLDAIERLISSIDDSDLLAAGNKRVKERSLQRGQDLLEAASTEHGPEWVKEVLQGPIPPSRQSATWFFEGFSRAINEKITEARMHMLADRSRARLHRAFQILADAARLGEPTRFVTVVTVLETLMSTGTSELRYQVALRTAWLLMAKASENLNRAEIDWEAKKPMAQVLTNQRIAIYEDISAKYNLRSRIVHGDQFPWEKLHEHSGELLRIMKSVFTAILSDDTLFELYMNPKDAELKAFLKELPLGT